jgi:hypothetical protein
MAAVVPAMAAAVVPVMVVADVLAMAVVVVLVMAVVVVLVMAVVVVRVMAVVVVLVMAVVVVLVMAVVVEAVLLAVVNLKEVADELASFSSEASPRFGAHDHDLLGVFPQIPQEDDHQHGHQSAQLPSTCCRARSGHRTIWRSTPMAVSRPSSIMRPMISRSSNPGRS